MGKIKFKCSFQDQTRVVRLSADAGLTALKERLDGDFGFPVALGYDDEEGDRIVLQTENDFEEMLEELEGAKSIKLVVTKAAAAPAASTAVPAVASTAAASKSEPAAPATANAAAGSEPAAAVAVSSTPPAAAADAQTSADGRGGSGDHHDHDHDGGNHDDDDDDGNDDDGNDDDGTTAPAPTSSGSGHAAAPNKPALPVATGDDHDSAPAAPLPRASVGGGRPVDTRRKAAPNRSYEVTVTMVEPDEEELMTSPGFSAFVVNDDEEQVRGHRCPTSCLLLCTLHPIPFFAPRWSCHHGHQMVVQTALCGDVLSSEHVALLVNWCFGALTRACYTERFCSEAASLAHPANRRRRRPGR